MNRTTMAILSVIAVATLIPTVYATTSVEDYCKDNSSGTVYNLLCDAIDNNPFTADEKNWKKVGVVFMKQKSDSFSSNHLYNTFTMRMGCDQQGTMLDHQIVIDSGDEWFDLINTTVNDNNITWKFKKVIQTTYDLHVTGTLACIKEV